MSDEEAAFMRAILAEPDGDAPRLVFADWLDEHGQAERAEYIRLACCGGNPEREGALLKAYFEAWSAHLPQDPEGQWSLNFDRGLPTKLRVGDPQDFAASTHATAALARASTLDLGGLHDVPGAQPLFDRPDLGSVQRLEMRGRGGRWPVQLGPILGRHLRQLTCLDLRLHNLGDDGLAALLANADVSRLVELHLSGNRLTNAGALVLTQQIFSNLRILNLAANSIGDSGAIALARSEAFPNLRELVLGSNLIDDPGVCELARSTTLGQLEELHLWGNDFTPVATEALADLPFRVVSDEARPRQHAQDDRIVLRRPPEVNSWLRGQRSEEVVPAWLALWFWPVVGVLRASGPAIWLVLALCVWVQPGWTLLAVPLLAGIVGAMAGILQCLEPILTRLACSRWRSLIGAALAVGGGWLAADEVGMFASAFGLVLAWLGVTLGAVVWARRAESDHTAGCLDLLAAMLIVCLGGLILAVNNVSRGSTRYPGHGRDLLVLPTVFAALAGGLGGAFSANVGAAMGVGALIGFAVTLVLGGVLVGYSWNNPAVAILDHEAYIAALATAGGSALVFLVAWQGGLLGLASAPWSAWLSLAGVFLASAIGASVAVGKPTHLFRQMRTAIRHRQRLWG